MHSEDSGLTWKISKKITSSSLIEQFNNFRQIFVLWLIVVLVSCTLDAYNFTSFVIFAYIFDVWCLCFF